MYMSPEEVAKKFDVSYQTIINKCLKKEIKSIKAGNLVLIPMEQFDVPKEQKIDFTSEKDISIFLGVSVYIVKKLLRLGKIIKEEKSVRAFQEQNRLYLNYCTRYKKKKRT